MRVGWLILLLLPGAAFGAKVGAYEQRIRVMADELKRDAGLRQAAAERVKLFLRDPRNSFFTGRALTAMAGPDGFAGGTDNLGASGTAAEDWVRKEPRAAAALLAALGSKTRRQALSAALGDMSDAGRDGDGRAFPRVSEQDMQGHEPNAGRRRMARNRTRQFLDIAGRISKDMARAGAPEKTWLEKFKDWLD
jgi:hypothetical protein